MASPPSAPVPTGPALHEAKRELREATMAARDALDAQARSQDSATIARAIGSLPSFAGASCALLTLPFRSEWDSRPLLEAVLARGAAAVLPRVETASRMLALHLVRDPATDIAAGYRGIPEPREHLPRVDVQAVDWVLVPGVAFDTQGHRLGYGGGYYDRLLALMPRSVPRVAGAFDLQVVPAVPAAPHDLSVDTIVTPTRTLAAPAR